MTLSHVNMQEEARKSEGLPPLVPEEELRARLKRLQTLMKENNIDALWVFGSPTEPSWIRYLANYVHPFVIAESFLLVTQNDPEPTLLIDRPWFLINAREMSYIQDIRVIPYVEFQWQFEELKKLMLNLLAEKGVDRGKIGICEIRMPSVYLKALQEALPAEAEIIDATGALWRLIEDKSEYDIKKIRQTALIADEGMKKALEMCKEGVPEFEVGLEAEKTIASLGGEFGTGSTVRTHLYVGSGSKVLSNVRPYKYTGRRLQKGDMFFIDLSVCYHGYYIDFCRTVSIGKPNSEQQKIFDVVKESHDALFQALKPGVSGEEVFEAGNRVAVKYGMAEVINHVWFGHGTGIIISEPPFFHRGEKRKIRKNTFVNIEPGIFLPEIGLASIEDATFVGENGVEFVTNCPRELHIG